MTIAHQTVVSAPATRRARTLLISLSFFLPALLAFAQAPAGDSPFIWTAEDTALQWGPCPDFLPAGCELAVLQGDPAQRNADVFLKVPGNSTVAHHWHTSAERMVLVAGEMHVQYDGHQRFVLRRGTYAYGPAGLPHTAWCESTEPCILFIAFEEAVDAVPVSR